MNETFFGYLYDKIDFYCLKDLKKRTNIVKKHDYMFSEYKHNMIFLEILNKNNHKNIPTMFYTIKLPSSTKEIKSRIHSLENPYIKTFFNNGEYKRIFNIKDKNV